MTGQMQPVNKGVNEKGELVWGEIPMAEWQKRMIQALVPIPYVGDFLAFWVKHTFFHKTGYESDEPIPNMDLKTGHYKSKLHARKHHRGD